MMGLKPSRRDDLISILYMLIFLKEGSLPWFNIDNRGERVRIFQRIKELKIKFHSNLVETRHLNCVLRSLLVYCDELNYDDEPDYNFVVAKLLKTLPLTMKGIDWVMDWS